MGSHGIFFDIAYFMQHDYFKIHSKLWNSYAIVPFFYSCKVFQYIDILEFLIHLPVNSCSNFLQFGSSTNKTAVKTHAQISIQAYLFFFFFLLGCDFGVEWLGHMVGLAWTIWESVKLFSKVAIYTILHFHHHVWEFQLLTSLPGMVTS